MSTMTQIPNTPPFPTSRNFPPPRPVRLPPQDAPPPVSEHGTDLGNCRRLVSRFGDQFRYEAGKRTFLVWDAGKWVSDYSGQMQRWARETVGEIYHEAGEGATPEERSRLARWAEASEAEPRLNAMIRMTKDEAGIAAQTVEFDARSHIVNLQNGALDMDAKAKTFDFREHRRGDLCTKMAGAAYDDSATCPKWDAFLEMILPDPEVRELLRRAVGRSLLGGSERRQVFICYGGGGNGKTTFLETIKMLLGDYGTVTPIETVVGRREGTIPSDLARLQRIRFVYASEPDKNKVLSEAEIKKLTSGGEIAARFMHQDWITFKPEFSLWIDTNHRPIIKNNDNGIWDRVRLIPFTVRLPDILPPEQIISNDEALAQLRPELAGILNWALGGLTDYLRMGLGSAAAVEAAGQAYRSESDVLGAFIDEHYAVGAAGQTPLAEVYQTYQRWAEGNGMAPMTKVSLGRELKERGWSQKPVRCGEGVAHCWLGVTAKADAAEDMVDATDGAASLPA